MINRMEGNAMAGNYRCQVITENAGGAATNQCKHTCAAEGQWEVTDNKYTCKQHIKQATKGKELIYMTEYRGWYFCDTLGGHIDN